MMTTTDDYLDEARLRIKEMRIAGFDPDTAQQVSMKKGRAILSHVSPGSDLWIVTYWRGGDWVFTSPSSTPEGAVAQWLRRTNG